MGHEEAAYYSGLQDQYKNAPHRGAVDIATWLNGTTRTYAGDTETIASALFDKEVSVYDPKTGTYSTKNVNRGGASAYAAQKTAQELLGKNLHVQLPADIGGILKLLTSFDGNSSFSFLPNSIDVDRIRRDIANGTIDLASGYIRGSVLLGAPVPRGEKGSFSDIDFINAFGQAAHDIYYPTFKNIYDNPALDALYKDPRIGSSPQMSALKEGRLIDLMTYSRNLRLQVHSATDQFFAEAAELFNTVSTIPRLNNTAAGNLGFEVGKDNELYKDNQATGIWPMFSGNVRFGGSWFGQLHDLAPKALKEQAARLDGMSNILTPSQKRFYENGKQQAKLNALKLGAEEWREKWMEKADGFNAGGSVAGRGNKDTVPAMLTPGEFVMRRSAVDKYGSAFMSSINSGLAYFAEGGPVGFASSQFEKGGISPILEDMSHSLTSIDGSNQNILVGQRSLQRNQQVGFGAVEGGLGSIGPEISTRFDDLVSRLDGAFFNNFDGYKFNSGGGVPGSGSRDTVPAMLTPGEFVMKKSAVQRYGLGFMRAINGSSPSVRVGTGVQYKTDGDVMGAGGGIDFSGLFKNLGTFGSLVSSSLSSFESAFLGFSKLSSMLSDTINSIANLNITHTLNVSGSLNIPGFSQQAIDNIVNTISHQIAESTDGKVKQALRNFKRNLDNRT